MNLPKESPPKETAYCPKRLSDALPKRWEDSHKGSYGCVLVAAGAKNMAGAAYFCAKAAYRAGAGLVILYVPECNRGILQQLIPEAVLATYDAEHWDSRALLDALGRATSVVAGPGLGMEDPIPRILKPLLDADLPRVFDADALNLLARDPALLAGAKKPFVITPHMGEMARLTGKDARWLAARDGEAAWAFAKRHGIVTALKGHRTVVSDGERISRNTTGNHGMATGGSGDVLSGVIAGLLAQGMPLFDAARLGVYLHGLAGDAARDARGAYAMMAGDLLDYLLLGL